MRLSFHPHFIDVLAHFVVRIFSERKFAVPDAQQKTPYSCISMENGHPSDTTIPVTFS